MDLFLLLVSQIFDAFVEISNLFLIILDILVKFSNFSFILEFMLLTRFDWAVEAMNVTGKTFVSVVVLSEVILLDWAVALVAVAEAVNVLVAFVLSRILRGYESEGKWMSLFRDMIFCVFCINIAR